MVRLNKNKFTAIGLVFVILFTIGQDRCGNNFDRAIAALEAAPILIDSFSNSNGNEKTKLKLLFTTSAAALKAYKLVKSSGNWSAFISSIEAIAKAQISDEKGRARITAIVVFVKIIFGISDSGVMGIVSAPPPDLKKIKDSDIKHLEELMQPF